MPISPDEMIQRQAQQALSNLIHRIKVLENNDYFNFLYGEGEWHVSSVATPPSEALVISIFGEPTSFNALVMGALLINTWNGDCWLLHSSATQNKWYCTQLQVLT